MYLKSLTIKNFRKFGTNDNTIEFVDGSSYRKEQESDYINVGSTTTLIVGKNNTGKTTIVHALEKIVKERKFEVNDFNFVYLQMLLDSYKKQHITPQKVENIEIPYLEFLIKIGFEDDYTQDLIGNLVPFLIIDNITDKKEIEIIVKVEIKEDELFIQKIIKLLNNNIEEEKVFPAFLKILDETDFEVNYYRENGDQVQYNLKNLIDITSIKANIVDSDTSLTKAFNKIIKYRYKSLLDEKDREDFDQSLDETNTLLTNKINEQHTGTIGETLGEIVSTDNLSFSLTADLTLEKIMTNVIKYEYIEGDIHIPENQFGLGYTNLMMIIAELVDYMERYPEKSFNSMVNIISIEEPETYMHPQMQELFIKNINDAVRTLLEGKEKNINSQLIITTHSSHILNSKIHSGNTFNNINYLTSEEQFTKVINLNDANVITKDSNKEKLNFLKKHIKYKVSELFFADAIIFVEGITEETIIKYFIDENIKELSRYYITIFNIDGSHGLVYHDLIKLLKVPCLIITDLDIQRNDDEKKHLKQINSVKGKETTNQTIINYINEKLDRIETQPFYESQNMYIAYQGEKIEDYYATSFEEALILTNYDNKLLNNALKDTRRNIYNKEVVTESGVDYTKLKEKSYFFQHKLSEKKSKFANTLLSRLISDENDDFRLPSYIMSGLDWLSKKLKEGK